MDISVLTTFLLPFLPFLTKLGQTASEKAGEKFGEEAWNKAKAIWTTLHPNIEARKDLQDAVEKAAAKPDSEPRKAVLQEELEAVLTETPDLAAAIARILQGNASSSTPTIQIEQMSGGTVSGTVQGSIFNISDTSITNLTGSGDIHHQEAIHQPFTSNKEAKDKNQSSSVKTILVLAANPYGTHQLRLGEEVRKLQASLDRSHHRDRFQIESYWAVTPSDVRQALLKFKPYIVHFSGHGVGADPHNETFPTRKATIVSSSIATPEGLIFEDETGQPKLVSAIAIARLFALFSDQIECVVLNACYSEVQAAAIAQHIPYVIGMKQAIIDTAAIEFTIGFYDAILAGRSIKFAYDLGCSAIQMAGIPEQLTPVLGGLSFW